MNQLRRTDFGFNLKSYFVPSHLSNHQLLGAEKSKPSICWPAAAAAVGFHSAPKRKEEHSQKPLRLVFAESMSLALATALDLVDSSTSAYSGVTYHIPCTPLTDHSIVYLFCGSSLSTQELATQQTILCRGAPGNYSSRNSLQEGIFFWILFTLFLMDISF